MNRDPRVQDAYSLRCTPQVHGAARDTIEFARRIADTELRSAIDNPSVMPDGRVESCGHFHGAPVGFACDFLAIAAAEVGAISERRVDRMLDVCRSRDLPPFLSPDAGVNSGLMIAQYTAAGIVAENRRLASPASVDSLPTSGMQEDHVSMGWAAARKLRTVIDNLTSLLAVELLASVRALQLRAQLEPSPAGRIAVSNYFVAATNFDGDHRVCMANVDPAGRLSLDRTFRDERTHTPCVGFNRPDWPHGATGDARPHGVLFVVSDADVR